MKSCLNAAKDCQAVAGCATSGTDAGSGGSSGGPNSCPPAYVSSTPFQCAGSCRQHTVDGKTFCSQSCGKTSDCTDPTTSVCSQNAGVCLAHCSTNADCTQLGFGTCQQVFTPDGNQAMACD